jgi:predicted DNA-binding transcriptional regulator AlpA
MKLFRFVDLKANGVAKSWPQLYRMIELYGFPAGRLLSPQVRVWTDTEIDAWLATRPVRADAAPRGVAKSRRGRPRKPAAQQPEAGT